MSYRFKDARVQSGISQKDAAEQLQVSAATVNNWESGRRLPTIDALEKMNIKAAFRLNIFKLACIIMVCSMRIP